MVKELDIDDIEKLFGSFGYHIEKDVGFCLGKAVEMYGVRDSNERIVHCEGPYGEAQPSLILTCLHNLRTALSQSSRFFVKGDVDCSSISTAAGVISSSVIIPPKINIKKNMYQGMSPHEMMIAYDLASGGEEQ